MTSLALLAVCLAGSFRIVLQNKQQQSIFTQNAPVRCTTLPSLALAFRVFVLSFSFWVFVLSFSFWVVILSLSCDILALVLPFGILLQHEHDQFSCTCSRALRQPAKPCPCLSIRLCCPFLLHPCPSACPSTGHPGKSAKVIIYVQANVRNELHHPAEPFPFLSIPHPCLCLLDRSPAKNNAVT